MRRCKEGFIKTYLEYAKGQESPEIFHTWAALGTISSILRRHVWLESSGSKTEPGFYRLYPNLYIVLVSPSGVGKKSTAIDLGMELIDLSGVEINVIRGAITHTRLISRLNAALLANPDGAAEIMVFNREFKVFTKGIISDSPLIEYLTDIFDCGKFDYETEHSIQHQIKKPLVTLLAASTPEWLSGGRAGDLLSGGFGARMLPITLIKEEKRITWPTKSTVEIELQEKLIHDLVEMNKLKGAFWVTEEGKQYFDQWYQTAERNKMHKDDRLRGFYSKKHDLVRKVSMVLSASFNDDMVITGDHLELALIMFNKIEENILFAYAGASHTDKGAWADLLLQKIREYGKEWVDHSTLLQRVRGRMTGQDMRETIQTLVEANEIEYKKENTATKVKFWYRAKYD